MNQKLISKYLQLLRKRQGLTQEDLAKQLSITRQAISKWETGDTIPDLEILLKLSKIYQITINEILEPHMELFNIESFEQIIEIDRSKIKMVLSNFSDEDLVKASKGASPMINDFLTELFPEINFKTEQAKIGLIKIEEVEEIQNEIVSLINMS